MPLANFGGGLPPIGGPSDFYAARSEPTPPLPWSTFAPPSPRGFVPPRQKMSASGDERLCYLTNSVCLPPVRNLSPAPNAVLQYVAKPAREQGQEANRWIHSAIAPSADQNGRPVREDYFCRGSTRLAPIRGNVPARCTISASASASAALRTSPCIAASLSSASWLVA